MDIQWEKLKLPDEVARDEIDKLLEDEDEESYTPYQEYENQPNKPLFIGQDANPFMQLRHFNFWTMHADFPISLNILNLLNETDGVEVVIPVSKYRAQVAFGKVFNEKIVQDSIKTSLNVALHEKTN